MKRIALFFASLLLIGVSAQATTTTIEETASTTNFVRGYGNSFIFVENGIEFSVFPDGQFDFYMPNYGPEVSVGINTPGVSISFNSGYNYSPYVQYDDFGAIIQIENTPIFYDYYGRITQVGNINIHYNNIGFISRVGGLYVHYARPRVFSHCTGFINIYNRSYIYRPWHSYYVVPSYNYCIVQPRPYRQYYQPVRYTYYRPYVDNRRYVNVNSRRYSSPRAISERSRISNRYRQSPRAGERAVTSRNRTSGRDYTLRSNDTRRRVGNNVRGMESRGSNNLNSARTSNRNVVSNRTQSRTNGKGTTHTNPRRSNDKVLAASQRSTRNVESKTRTSNGRSTEAVQKNRRQQRTTAMAQRPTSRSPKNMPSVRTNNPAPKRNVQSRKPSTPKTRILNTERRNTSSRNVSPTRSSSQRKARTSDTRTPQKATKSNGRRRG